MSTNKKVSKLLLILVCFSMITISWSEMINFEEEYSGDISPELELESPRMSTNVGTVISFNTTWTSANSPYYLNSPVSVQQGVRLTIDPGVQVFANTTNASIIVHGEIHSLGTTANPVTIGVNPSLSWGPSSGYWAGIRGATPNQGYDSLILQNTTISGPTNYWYTPGSSWTGNSNLFDFEYFFRQNADVIIDNTTMRDGKEVNIRGNSGYSSLTVNNFTLDNISYTTIQGGNFYYSCNGDWRDEVTVKRTGLYIDNAVYMSTTNWDCNNYRSMFDGWTYIQSDVRLQASNAWNSATASNPAWFSGTFTDTSIELVGNSGWSGPLYLSNSTFNATGSPTATVWTYSQYASQRGTAFIIASSSSYGKWDVANNSFAPTNGWTGIEYTYSVGHMGAPYNYWGTNSTSAIDNLIEDMLDNNGGGWVNYSPFYTTPAMNQLDWNGTSPSNIPLTRELSGTLFFSKTMTLNNSPYYLVGPWTIAPGVRITIDPGVQVFANTTNASIIVHGEIHSLGTTANPVTIGVNPSLSWGPSSGYWAGIRGATPNQGYDSLILQNTTISGPTNYWYTPGSSWTGNSNLFDFEYFFRQNADVIIDNTTMRDGKEVNIRGNSGYSSLTVNNFTLDNISYTTIQGGNFYYSCNGDWRDEVTVKRTGLYIDNAVYMSTTNWDCNNYRSMFDGWTYIQSDVRLQASNAWNSATASNPAWFSGTFTDTSIELVGNSGWSGPLYLSNSTFNATGSPTATVWTYSQYASQRGTAFIIASSSSYGKWDVANNSFAPTNGWTGIEYTYQNNRMDASYNYWGTNNRTNIDGLIEDINDNNGGNWVNYCPFWSSPAMNTLSSNCTRTRVDFTSPTNGSSQVGYNLTVNYTHLMVSIGDWYLNNNSLETFNTSNNSITLTGLTMGWNQLCAQVSGVGNQQGRYCISFQMTPYFPDVDISWPTASHGILPTQTSEMIYYNTSNITSGYWTLDGINIGPLNINGSSAQITGLQYGNNSICIVGLGLSNLVDSDCINIWRSYPPVVVIINSPADGATIYGQDAVVNYSTSNVTSATWLLDGVDVGTLQLSQSSRTFPALSWGPHTICITPYGLDGQHPDVCVNFTIVAPQLDVQINSPANDSSVPADQVTIDYTINNATEGNWTLNGVPVSSVTLWNQQIVILNLQIGSNIICIEAYGENNQYQSVCVTIIGHNLDSDLDGVPDNADNCSDTPLGTLVTPDGCTDPTSDIDQDGVPDLNDTCPDTPNGEIADANGCGPSQRDSDNDGVSDDVDACNNTVPGAAIDSNGCANSQIDSDEDGVFDDVDAFPIDPTQTTDSDGDGYGDDSEGNNPDFFPNDSTQWSDYDRDGWGDNPQGNDADGCPLIAGVIDGVPGKGCPAAVEEPSNNNTNNSGNQTINQTAPDCPLCGLNYYIPGQTKVNQSVQFTVEVTYTLGANYWDNYTISWDFGDGVTSSDEEPSHTYIEVPNNGEHTVTLCINFEEGPESCKSGTIEIIPEDISPPSDNNSNNNQTGEEPQTNVGGSFNYIGIVAIGVGLLILILLTTLILRVRKKPSDEINEFKSNPEVEDEDEMNQTNEVEEQSEYEWLEYPDDSGQWYYREPGDEDWIMFEQ